MKFTYKDNTISESNRLTYPNKENKLMKKQKERNSSFELLRIILITLIVLHHIFINTNSLKKLNRTNYEKLIYWKYILLKIVSNYGKLGNNVFIMISGYFSVSKTKFNLYKFLYLIFEIYTYYYPSIYIGKKLSKKYQNLKFPNYLSYKIYFPILTSNGNWFIQIYLILLVFIPFINLGLLSLNKKDYKNLVIMIIIFYCVLNSIISLYNLNSSIFNTTPLIRLLLPYIIGGYIKMYGLYYKLIWEIVGIIYFPLTILSEIIFDILAKKNKNFNFIKFHLYLTYNINSILCIIGSMGFINLFKNLSFYNKKINFIAASVLGIYLIHGNKNISPFIYNIWFTTNNLNNKFFFIKYLIKAFLIIILSIVIDIVRRYTIGILIDKLIKKIIRL